MADTRKGVKFQLITDYSFSESHKVWNILTNSMNSAQVF